jgi:hypothetical protein
VLNILGVATGTVSGLTPGTVYYLTITRIANQTTLNVYSDPARTVLVGTTGAVTDPTPISAEYVYAVASDNHGLSKTVSGYMENLYLYHP